MIKKFEDFKNSFHVEVYSSNELEKIIYKNGQLKDLTLFKRIRYFSNSDFGWGELQNKPYYVALFDKDKIIGVAKIGHYSLNAKHDKNYSISFFSIDKDYRNMGLSRLMCDALFEFAKENGFDISTSTYTYLGKMYLQKLFNEYSKKHNVIFYDKDDKDWGLIDNEQQYTTYKKNILVHRSELED